MGHWQILFAGSFYTNTILLTNLKITIMKNLNENALMQEMNVNEMQEMNGGIPGLVWLAIGVLVSEALDRNAGNDFMDGWNAAKNNK